MNLIHKTKEETVSDIRAGSTFNCDGKFYIKTDYKYDGNCLCARLVNGETRFFKDTDIVLPISIEAVVK